MEHNQNLQSIKEKLQEIRRITKSVERLREEVERLRALAAGVQAVQYDKERVKASHAGNDLAETIAKIEQQERQYVEEVERLLEVKERILQRINRMQTPVYQTILYERYCNFKKWEQIAEELGYDVRHIFRQHDNALCEFKKEY